MKENKEVADTNVGDIEKNSIEEDIKDIKKYISFTSKRENFSHDTDWYWNKELGNQIEHILSDYKRVLKENEGLKRLHIQDNKHLDFIMKHSIPVQKVKEKIKELETELKKAEKDLQEAIRLEKEAKAKEGTILWWTAQIRLDERIKTLKEILRRIKNGDNV